MIAYSSSLYALEGVKGSPIRAGVNEGVAKGSVLELWTFLTGRVTGTCRKIPRKWHGPCAFNILERFTIMARLAASKAGCHTSKCDTLHICDNSKAL